MMNIRVEILFIILGFLIGLFIIYIITPPPKIVIKYPTIDNIENTTYVDENNQCYRYYASEIPCKMH